MNWEAIGAVGESLGGVAVLVTLIYLAVQVRQNTAQQKLEEPASIQHGQNAVVAQLQNPQVMGAYVRTAEERSPSVEDRGTCPSFVVHYLNHFQLIDARLRDPKRPPIPITEMWSQFSGDAWARGGPKTTDWR